MSRRDIPVFTLSVTMGPFLGARGAYGESSINFSRLPSCLAGVNKPAHQLVQPTFYGVDDLQTGQARTNPGARSNKLAGKM
jgi:hypothetical protein